MVLQPGKCEQSWSSLVVRGGGPQGEGGCIRGGGRWRTLSHSALGTPGGCADP